MKNRTWFFLSIFTFLSALSMGSSPALAQEGTPQPTEALAKWVHRDQTYVLVFKDGREGTLTETVRKPNRLSMKMRQIENTCAPQQTLARCELRFDISPLLNEVRWSKHPDSSKMDQVLVMNLKNGPGMVTSTPLMLIDQNFLFYSDHKYFPQYKNLFQLDDLNCDSLDWLKEAPREGNKFRIASWSSELMNQNPETSASENMSRGSSYNMDLEMADDHTVNIKDIASSFSQNFDIAPAYIVGQVINLSYQRQDGKICQVAFESNFNNLISSLQQPDFQKTDPSLRRNADYAKEFSSSSFYFKMIQLLIPGNGANVEGVD